MASRKALCKCRMPYAECVCDEEEEAMEAEALTPEIAQELAATRAAALKPGDVLAVRVPLSLTAAHMNHLRSYGDRVEAETGVKVAFIPGEEFAHVTLNVTVNGADTAAIAEAVRREIAAQARAARTPGTLARL